MVNTNTCQLCHHIFKVVFDKVWEEPMSHNTDSNRNRYLWQEAEESLVLFIKYDAPEKVTTSRITRQSSSLIIKPVTIAEI